MSGRSGRGRTWPQRLVIGCHVVAILAATVTAGALAYGNDRVAHIPRVVIQQVRGPDGEIIRREVEPGEPRNYLIVGVDDASGLPDGDNVKRRPSGGLNTDTIMILRIDPKKTTADIVSFPRDMRVAIAGTESRRRINSALAVGGPSRLVQTIWENFAIPVHRYIQIDFAGFRKLVEVVGGVPIQFPRPVRASAESVELDIPEAGCWVLGPRQALGFSRARKDYAVQDDDGDWHVDPRGDHSRVERQQLFIQLGLRAAITKGARNPNTLRRLIDLGVASITTDTELEPQELVDVGQDFRSFDPAELVTHTLPVDDATSGAAYSYLREDEAEPTLALFRGDDPAAVGAVAPGGVVVQVRNGTGVEGQAGQVSEELAAIGFETVVTSDIAVGFPTTVLYATGSEAAAQTVARHLVGPVRYEVADSLGEADVVVSTGSDWAGTTPTARPADDVPAPSTTAPPFGPPPTSLDDEEEAEGSVAPGVPVDDEGDPNDPDDRAFYKAHAPAPGATCRPTQ